nr:RibD C-terminal domain protein [uncultured bacterium]
MTFTITVRNEGAADLVKVPIQDSYQAEYLQFWNAVPPPSQSAPGLVSWEDVLGVINRAGATGLRDEFQNELPAPRQAEVPIRIIAGPNEAQPTATATPKPRSKPQQATSTPETSTPVIGTPATIAITATSELTATASVPTSSPTPTLVPANLPRTGTGDPSNTWLIVALALLLGGILALRYLMIHEEAQTDTK